MKQVYFTLNMYKVHVYIKHFYIVTFANGRWHGINV